MKVIGINGSPRKGWNTSVLVRDALGGAADAGAEVEMFDLYDMGTTGCTSCFGCKRVGIEDHRCCMKDGMTPALDAAREADALIIGSPIYFMGLSAGTEAFMERLMFPYTTYGNGDTFCAKPVRLAYIYTMNITGEQHRSYGVDFNRFRNFSGALMRCEPVELFCYNTWQYRDYDRYEHSCFDMEAKRRQRDEVFSKDREAVRELGRRMAQSSGSSES